MKKKPTPIKAQEFIDFFREKGFQIVRFSIKDGKVRFDLVEIPDESGDPFEGTTL